MIEDLAEIYEYNKALKKVIIKFEDFEPNKKKKYQNFFILKEEILKEH